MVLTADQQIEVLALVVSLEALEAPHLLLLICKHLRLDVAEVMPTVRARGNLSWTQVTSILHNFPKAKHLSFSYQRDDALITELVEGRELHTLRLSMCTGVTDVSALVGCASLHTLDLSHCYEVRDVSPLAGCASLHTLVLSYCPGVTDVSALAGCASLHTLNLSSCDGVTDVSALAGCASLRTLNH